MPLQSDEFRVLGLGVLGDLPPDGLQPKLADGVHLRWAFDRPLGFPWYGFYIYRRGHKPLNAHCIQPQLASLPAQTWPAPEMNLIDGVITSDAPLQLTDDFPPPGVELDLRQRRALRYTLYETSVAYQVDVTIGFRAAERTRRDCLRWASEVRRPNPFDQKLAKFIARDARKQPEKEVRIDSVDAGGEKTFGLRVGPSLVIELAEARNELELVLATRDLDAVTVESEGGRRPKITRTPAAGGKPQRLAVSGQDLKSLILAGPAETFLLELCLPRAAAAREEIEVIAFSKGVEVARQRVSGAEGDVVQTTLVGSSITDVEIAGGNAALIDLCSFAIEDGAREGWDQVGGGGGFRFPLCLPITHPDYPCSGRAPVNAPAAEGRALGRVKYGPAARWGGAMFADLHQTLITLVTGGPAGPPMAEKMSAPAVGVAVPPDPGVDPPTLPPQRILDLVLLASIHPAFAQMVGLYWIDETAQPGQLYDYLVVGDYDGVGGGDAAALLRHITASGFDDVYAAIAFALRAEAAVPLETPTDARAYALPENNAGLRWNLGLLPTNVLATRSAVLYHIWRASLGNGNAPVPGAPAAIITAQAPILIPQSLLEGATPQRADDWPPFPLYFTDRGLADGWYAYHVTGVDLFGRHSVRSSAAEWRQWAPEPDPTPWYYVLPASDAVIHASAVRLLDKTLPPPPVGVEAFALAPHEPRASPPDDPLIVRDPPFNAWNATLTAVERESIVGLRVRWRWEAEQMRQAPNVREFRVYYQSGLANVLFGQITAVTPSGATSTVQTDIANARPANAFTGATLQIGQNGFRITGSDAGAPLRLRIENRGLTYNTGSVTVANGSAVVDGSGTSWHLGMNGLSLQVTGDAAVYRILRVETATRLVLATTYAGVGAPSAAYTIFDLRPAIGPCAISLPDAYAAGSVQVQNGSATVTGSGTSWNAAMVGMRIRIEGSTRRYRIASVTNATQLVLDRLYDGEQGSGRVYSIVFPLFTDFSDSRSFERRMYVVGWNDHVHVAADGTRSYELFLPAVGDADRAGLPLAPTLADPIVYALVGVSAADQKLHTPDAAKWVGSPFGNRPGNEGPAGGPSTIFRVRRVPPDPPEPPVVAEYLYATAADYHSRSFTTFRWSHAANLRANVYRALDDALFAVDWITGRTRNALDPAELRWFPSEGNDPRWDDALRRDVARDLNAIHAHPNTAEGKRAAMRDYHALSDDALRVLAGLDKNDQAFVLLHAHPLDGNDAATADRRGPDDPDAYAPNAAWRAYLDTLDGRARNRYLYRAAYVDAAGNVSPLGLAGPPVRLPDVIPPRAPVIVRVLGAERQITVAWASNREPDLAEYRVYRAESEAAARDIRLMQLIHNEAVDPAIDPALVSFVDAVPGLKTFYYRVVAVDADGNASIPSTTVSGRAFDETLPPAIAPQTAWVAAAGETRAEVRWESAQDESMLQRRTGPFWIDLVPWSPPGAFVFRDESSDPARAVTYRVWTRQYTGAITRGAPVELAPQ